jgi:hypothetical protein
MIVEVRRVEMIVFGVEMGCKKFGRQVRLSPAFGGEG